MLPYEKYNVEMHKLFLQAYGTRCNPDSTETELYEADKILGEAIALSEQAEQDTELQEVRHEILNDRLRCYIERITLNTGLLKAAYGTDQFAVISRQQETYCLQYMQPIVPIFDDEEIRQSLSQLGIIARQSLAANYFRRGGLGKDKTLCQKAVGYLDEAMQLAEGSKLYDVLQANKQQILQAMK